LAKLAAMLAREYAEAVLAELQKGETDAGTKD
jgi:hypothetical protein